MFDVKWDLKQFNDVFDRAKSLSAELRGKAGRRATLDAARVIVGAAKNNAQQVDDPRTKNQISKNIVSRFDARYAKRTGDLKARVGVLGGARDYSAYGEIKTGRSASNNPGGDTFYWRFLEFGTQTAPAHPILRPALSENTGAVIDQFASSLEREINKLTK